MGTPYEAAEREKEDRKQYARYLADFTTELVAPGLDVQPLSFEAWCALMPETEPNPAIRGAVATSKSLWNEKGKQEQAIVAGSSRPLEDSELGALGFDLRSRIDHPAQQPSTWTIQAAFEQFEKNTPTYDTELHIDAICNFLRRNRLEPNVENISRTFMLLLGMQVLQPMPAEPEPEPRNPDLNEHGVNLRIQSSPQWEREQRFRDYYEKVVARDPVTGEEFTEAQLDRMDSEKYRRVVFGERYQPKVHDVIRSQN